MRGKSTCGEGTPRLVDGVLFDGFGEALVGQIEDYGVEEHPEKRSWEAGEDDEDIWGRIAR